MNCVHCLLTSERRIQWINTCTLVAAATVSTAGGIIRCGRGKKRKRPKNSNNYQPLTTRVDVSETFNAYQLWFRIPSGLFQRCSLPENLWTALIQLWTALKTESFRAKNQRWNSAHFLWNRADSELNSADFLWNRADFHWNSAETPNFQSEKNQLWISAVSALIFPETELITTEAFGEAVWNSSYHSWFSPETTLNIPEICVFQFLFVLTGLFCNFSPGKIRYYAFWIIISYCFSANTRSFIFRKLLQESSSLTVSGNCFLIIFLQKIDLILFPQIFSRKPQILSSPDFYILFFFRKFLPESLDLTFPGNLEIIPSSQN